MDTLVIKRLIVEPRAVGDDMNLTLFVSSSTFPVPTHDQLVNRGLNLFWSIFGDDTKYRALNAEVMAWSDDKLRGLGVPHEYRVTIDFGLR